MTSSRHTCLVIALAALGASTPALAHPEDAPPPYPAQAPMMPAMQQPGYDRAAFEQARADWLAECRHRHGHGKTVGGALIGGVVGGVIGHEVAGRGDKTLGTIAGAAVGAAAGGAIGHGADRRGRMDYCESYLESHMSYGQGYGYPGYGYAQPVTYAYRPVTMMVPVAMVPMAAPATPAPQRECKETIVTEEWVPVAAPRRRYIAPRPAPSKRVRIVPDKRVRVY